MNEPQDIRQDLSAYLDGELSPPAAGRLDAAVRESPALADELGGLRATRAVLRGVGCARPGEGFAARVLAEAERRGLPAAVRRQGSAAGLWLGRLSAAAVLLLAAGLGVVVFAAVRRDGRPADPGRPEGTAVLLAEGTAEHETRGGRTLHGVSLAMGRPAGERRFGADARGKIAAKHAPRPPAKPTAAPTPTTDLPTVGMVAQAAPAPTRPAGSLAVAMKARLDRALDALCPAQAEVAVREVDVLVADLPAARRTVETALAGRQLSRRGRTAAKSKASCGDGVDSSGTAASAGFYELVWVGANEARYLVGGNAAQVGQVIRLLGRLPTDKESDALVEDLCAGGVQVVRSRPAPLPASRPRGATTKAAAKDNTFAYRIARIPRLRVPSQPAAPAAAAGPAPKDVRVLLITLRDRDANSVPVAELLRRAGDRRAPPK